MLPVNPSSWSCQSGDGHHTGLKCHQERTSFMWFPAAARSSPEPRHSRAGRYFSSTAPARIDHGLSESRSAHDSKVWVPCDIPPHTRIAPAHLDPPAARSLPGDRKDGQHLPQPRAELSFGILAGKAEATLVMMFSGEPEVPSGIRTGFLPLA